MTSTPHTKNRLLYFVLLFTFVPVAMAAENESLTSYLSQQVVSANEAVNATNSSDPVEDSMWFFRRFWIRLKPKVSFSIPGLVKVEVAPEVEMLWQRDLPIGWETYKPKVNP